MLRSMTAFARIEQEKGGLKIVWELRSVNHRYLDAHVRLPEGARLWEPQVRARIQQYVQRGRVDVSAVIELEEGGQAIQTLNKLKATQVQKLATQLQQEIGNATPLSVYEWMQLPGVLQAGTVDKALLEEGLLSGLEAGLGALLEAREQEGARLKVMLQSRLAALKGVAQAMRHEMPVLETQLKQRWQNKLAEFGGEGLDSQRLSQEMALLMTKNDAAEELDRLDAHIEELERIINNGGAVGRRLDFMMQELNREANTLGSKSYNQSMTTASVEMKVLIDQMREQIQNIE